MDDYDDDDDELKTTKEEEECYFKDVFTCTVDHPQSSQCKYPHKPKNHNHYTTARRRRKKESPGRPNENQKIKQNKNNRFLPLTLLLFARSSLTQTRRFVVFHTSNNVVGETEERRDRLAFSTHSNRDRRSIIFMIIQIIASIPFFFTQCDASLLPQSEAPEDAAHSSYAAK